MAQSGSAPRSHRGGQGFKSPQLHPQPGQGSSLTWLFCVRSECGGARSPRAAASRAERRRGRGPLPCQSAAAADLRVRIPVRACACTRRSGATSVKPGTVGRMRVSCTAEGYPQPPPPAGAAPGLGHALPGAAQPNRRRGRWSRRSRSGLAGQRGGISRCRENSQVGRGSVAPGVRCPVIRPSRWCPPFRMEAFPQGSVHGQGRSRRMLRGCERCRRTRRVTAGPVCSGLFMCI